MARDLIVEKLVEDSVSEIAKSNRAIANAITPLGAAPYNDGYGGHIGSLTEAFISVAAALNRIADAIEAKSDAMLE